MNQYALVVLYFVCVAFGLQVQDKDTVKVPGGIVPANCAIHVKPNSVIQFDGEFFVVSHPSGTTKHSQCKSSMKGGYSDLMVTWAEYDSINITSMTGLFGVPPVPELSEGQTLFIGNAVVNPGGVSGTPAYMGPILQYGTSVAGGGDYWCYVAWYNFGSIYFYTTPINVTSGDNLGSSITSSSGTWYSFGTDVNTGVNTDVVTVADSQKIITNFTVATSFLNDEHFKNCDEYPTSPVTFFDLSVGVDGMEVTPEWIAMIPETSMCGEYTFVNSPSSVTIYFSS